MWHTIIGRGILFLFLSLNDTPEIRSIFADFRLKGINKVYTVGNGQKSVQELLISNYEPSEPLSIESFLGDVRFKGICD